MYDKVFYIKTLNDYIRVKYVNVPKLIFVRY